MQLSAQDFQRWDDTPDEYFYQQPRMVTHIDDAAIAAVTQLYREYLPANGVILDLMSSWISHLPDDVDYKYVFGLGMNAAELAANPRLDDHLVQNLNVNPTLPFEESSFDGASICVSIDYLTDPVSVLRDLSRSLKTNAPVVITFSNRCFPTKAINAWLQRDMQGRLDLVETFLTQAGNWTNIQQLDRSPSPATDPLVAVIAYAN